MERIFIILIRVLIGFALCIAGLICVGQGFYMMLDVNFPTWGHAIAAMVGILAGIALLFSAWKLLSSTLRMPGNQAV